MHAEGNELTPSDLVYPLAHFEKQLEFLFPKKKQYRRGSRTETLKSSTLESPRPLSSYRAKRKKKSATHVALAGLHIFSSKSAMKKDKRPETIVAQIEALKEELNAMGCPYVPAKANVHRVDIIERIGKGSASTVYSCFVDGWFSMFAAFCALYLLFVAVFRMDMCYETCSNDKSRNAR